MECIEDIRSLLQGVLFAQSAGAYSLENSEQIAPIVRRILNKYPQLHGQTQTQVANRPLQPQQQPMTRNTQNASMSDQTEELIKKIKAEPNNIKEAPSNIETQLKENTLRQRTNQIKKSSIELDEPDIEAISLPIE